MLTKLEVDGFKNLRNVQVHFGPFTCIAGPNGVGKSNLFDAIAFLSALARMPLMDAALSIRGTAARHGDILNLFHRFGDKSTPRITLAAELLVPEQGEDALGQQAKASMTFLRYELTLRYKEDPSIRTMGSLQIEHERMTHINKGAAKEHLPFRHQKAWRDSVVKGRRTSPYISTEIHSDQLLVSLHADSVAGKGGGRPNRVPADRLPRTMLSTVTNAAEHRTLVLARNAMASWTQLHLEPSALRSADPFTAPRTIAPNGAHMPATLHALTRDAEIRQPGTGTDLHSQVANRLSELVESVRDLSIDVDEKRQLLSIIVTDRNGTSHAAGALSDGTLRFLALTIMEADPHGASLLCLEEPENGMHPQRIPAMIDLLRDIAVDSWTPVNVDNPLRQVIINTHSPAVIGCMVEDALLAATELRAHGGLEPDVFMTLRHLSGTWRSRIQPDTPSISLGQLMTYLDPMASVTLRTNDREGRRVVDRAEVQTAFRFGGTET